ncbi:MAG: exodeoxyribonuclease 7 small subunit [Paracoccaceae bacterium]|nr:MAG: exodeoxyribonuclease VII small subunit [Alphaproteobacteria bacterium]GIX13780.1 MAG: exodeoxyribonuclease 7 small subunit [Paracoccaceae bacterium]
MTEKPIAEMSFEEAMAALEAVVEKLESGAVPLEESIALYERGAALRAHCEEKLKAAEEKVAIITLGPDGQPTGTSRAENG